MKEYKKHPRIGIAGIKCPCCNPLNSWKKMKKTKQLINRRFRRLANQEMARN